jgi:phosphoserine phosphatase RsbU/P
VSHANDLLTRMTPVEVFVTLFFGILDTRTGLLTYVVAGHPAPLVLHGTGDVDALVGSSPIVGAFLRFRSRSTRPGCVGQISSSCTPTASPRSRSENGLFGSARIAESLSRHQPETRDLADLIRLVAAAESWPSRLKALAC